MAGWIPRTDRSCEVSAYLYSIDVHVGRRIRARRLEVGLTQAALGEALGVRFQQIQKYESGANRISASRLWRFCQALEVPAAYFFEGLPSTRGEASAPAEESADLLERPESLDLIRVFYQLDERPRRRLLDLAKSLSGTMDFA
jgi:transcriptional regulator with XRE-family HTH domain